MKTIEVCVEIESETDQAYLVNDGDKTVWLPKSQIQSETFEGEVLATLEIPEWLAVKKGLV